MKYPCEQCKSMVCEGCLKAARYVEALKRGEEKYRAGESMTRK